MGGKSKEAEFETYRLRIYPWVREIPEDEEGWRREGYSRRIRRFCLLWTD